MDAALPGGCLRGGCCAELRLELSGDEQAFGKRPFLVHTMPCCLEPCLPCHSDDVCQSVLVGTFGPDGFAGAKVHLEAAGSLDGDLVLDGGAQVHLHAVCRLVVKRLVLEQMQIEISLELAIDSSQQIEIER